MIAVRECLMILQSLCAYAAAFFCAYLYLQHRGAQSQVMPQTRRDEHSYIGEPVDQHANPLQEAFKDRDCRGSLSIACARAEHAREGASSSELAAKEAPVRLFWDHDNIPVTQKTFARILQGLGGGATVRILLLLERMQHLYMSCDLLPLSPVASHEPCCILPARQIFWSTRHIVAQRDMVGE